MISQPFLRLLRVAAALILPTAIITGCALDGSGTVLAPQSSLQLQAAPLATYTPFAVPQSSALSVAPTTESLPQQPQQASALQAIPQMPRVQPQSFIFPFARGLRDARELAPAARTRAACLATAGPFLDGAADRVG